jgi:hypothetical protein
MEAFERRSPWLGRLARASYLPLLVPVSAVEWAARWTRWLVVWVWTGRDTDPGL